MLFSYTRTVRISHTPLKVGFLIVGALVLAFFALEKNAVSQTLFHGTPSEDSTDISFQFLNEVLPAPTPHPATIDGLKNTPLSETQLQIEENLGANASYTSHRASYSSDGLTIYGLLTIPREEPPENGFPAIVFLHGYIPPNQYRTNERYVAYVDNLARSGFVVFKIDYRGHDQSEGEPSGAYFAPDYVRDAQHAVQALRQYDRVNSESIGLWGHSMSGNVALRTVVVDQNIQAAVIWAGAVYSYADRVAYGLNDNSFVRQRDAEQNIISRSGEILDTYGEYSPQSPFWQAMAPTNYLEGIETAIQLHHAENDSVVSPNYSRDLVKEFVKKGVEHEAYYYPIGGHDIEGTSFRTAMDRTVEFFQSHLINK